MTIILFFLLSSFVLGFLLRSKIIDKYPSLELGLAILGIVSILIMLYLDTKIKSIFTIVFIGIFIPYLSKLVRKYYGKRDLKEGKSP